MSSKVDAFQYYRIKARGAVEERDRIIALLKQLPESSELSELITQLEEE